MSRPRLVLASSSPRRCELLAAAGLTFEVRRPDVDESPYPGEPPTAYVARLARAKATAIPLRADELALGADTTVALGPRIVGKPRDADDARDMLHALSGATHEVYTGIAVRFGERVWCDVAITRVTFAPLDDDDIDWYVATGEPLDKAGAYAIQGRGGLFVRVIDGSPTSVVGLPLTVVAELLAAAGHPLRTFRASPQEVLS
jgi:nucleoside triphosphate pyrophosphatase